MSRRCVLTRSGFSLRRRNREAVVVAERGEVVGRENILRRGESGTMFDDGRRGLLQALRRNRRRRIAGLDGEDSDESEDIMPELEPEGSDEVAAFGNAMPPLPEMRTLF